MLSIMREQNVRDYVSYDCGGVLCKDCRHSKYCNAFAGTGLDEDLVVEIIKLDKLLSFIIEHKLSKTTIIAFINSTCIVSCDRCSGKELCGVLLFTAYFYGENILRIIDRAFILVNDESVRALYDNAIDE